MEVIIEDCTENGEEKIERACRTCYSSWYRFDPPKSTSELIQKVIKKRHFSVLEHAHATFRLKDISRVLTHQLIRHRLFSFSQESQRYVCYADTPDRNKTKDFMWIFPDTIFDYEIESYHNNFLNLLVQLSHFGSVIYLLLQFVFQSFRPLRNQKIH